MTSDACPQCNIPLMRSREGKILCTLCPPSDHDKASKAIVSQTIDSSKTLPAAVPAAIKLESMDKAADSLQSKIAQLSESLALAQDYTTIRGIADAIHSCAQALQSLQKNK